MGISGRQRWFNIQNVISVIYHIKYKKVETLYNYLSIEAKKKASHENSMSIYYLLKKKRTS